MSTGVDIMLFYKGVTFFPFLHRIYMRIENSFFSSIHYSPGPSGTAVGGKGLIYFLFFIFDSENKIVIVILMKLMFLLLTKSIGGIQKCMFFNGILKKYVHLYKVDTSL